MAEDCYYGGMKHNFVARYEEQPTKVHIEYAQLIEPSELKKLLFAQIYVRDICKWCGKTIERKR